MLAASASHLRKYCIRTQLTTHMLRPNTTCLNDNLCSCAMSLKANAINPPHRKDRFSAMPIVATFHIHFGPEVCWIKSELYIILVRAPTKNLFGLWSWRTKNTRKDWWFPDNAPSKLNQTKPRLMISPALPWEMIIAAFLNVCWLRLHILKYCACVFHEHPNLCVGAMSLEENTINPPQKKDRFCAPDQRWRLHSQSKASPAHFCF